MTERPMLQSRRVTDAAPTFVGIALLVMFIVPGRYAFGPSGVRLSTTTVFGLVALFVWLSTFLLRRRPSSWGLNPQVVLLLIYAAGLVLGASTAYARPLSQTESNGVLRTTVLLAGAVGLALMLAENTHSVAGLRRMTSLILLGGYFSALVGVLQKLFRFGYVDYWRNVPLLHTATEDIATSVLLSGRAVGTGAHPIEFSVACACLLPLALIHARTGTDRQRMLGHRAGAALLVAGALVGVSRSGFVALLIVAVMCIPRMPFRPRTNLIGAGVLVMAAVQFGLPGTLSTLRYQLLHIGDDASSRGRTADYGPVFDLVDRNPWRGIGAGTFNPTQYLFLDNAWLGTLVSTGIIGVAVLAVVLLASLYTGGLVKRRTAPASYEHELMHAACAMLLVLGVCAYFFDELSFTQTTTLLFVTVGVIGAGWTISRVADVLALADADGVAHHA